MTTAGRVSPTRTEQDALGERILPADALWGLSTLRAAENFPVSGRPVGSQRHLVWALGAVKLAAARANEALGLVDPKRARAIQAACLEVMAGRWDDEFTVDRIQGGAGTSTNMNANEVIANRAIVLLGGAPGEYDVVHPIDHVNRCQSTNDAYPTAVKLALHRSLTDLVNEHSLLVESFAAKGLEFAHVVKMGRTQLQDAVPMTLGQEFAAFAATLREDGERLQEAMSHLLEVNLGATAIGTGITAPPEYREAALAELAAATGLDVVPAADLVESTSDTGVFLLASSSLKRAAVKLSKICNDLRLLSSGPQAGLAEIQLPAVQAGSSIMPGKVNPVIPEMVNQVAFRVVGADATVTMAVEGGQLQLNAFEPVMADALLESSQWLRRACGLLRARCVDGIRTDPELLARRVGESVGVITALAPVIGYAAATSLAKEALASARPVADLVRERRLVPPERLADLLSTTALTGA